MGAPHVIFRKLKGLEDVISVVGDQDRISARRGWTLRHRPGATPATASTASRCLAEIYLLADPRYTGRVTVPVLWDKERSTIVNNESAGNHPHAQFGVRCVHRRCAPTTIRRRCAARSTRSTRSSSTNVNNGVYRAGFASTQEAYEEAFRDLFGTLDSWRSGCHASAISCGDAITEADWRLFTTLVRFDAVYYGHFKCNLRRIADYPNLSNYLRDLYQVPGVAETVNIDHIKRHYYMSMRTSIRRGIVPLGPALDFEAAHDRGEVRVGRAARAFGSPRVAGTGERKAYSPWIPSFFTSAAQ